MLKEKLKNAPSSEHMLQNIKVILNGRGMQEMNLERKHTVLMKTMDDWMQKLELYMTICDSEEFKTVFKTVLVPANFDDWIHNVLSNYCRCFLWKNDMDNNMEQVKCMIDFLTQLYPHLLKYAAFVDTYKASNLGTGA
jgi:hypothetical protein